MRKLSLLKIVCIVSMFCAAAGMVCSAQTKFRSLLSFTGNNGANPAFENLVQGPDGQLYGTTQLGSAGGSGTVFKITTAGKLKTLHFFCPHGENCLDGSVPLAGLMLASNGMFYGTTAIGGSNSDGTVFQITSAGKLKTLHSFNGADGFEPYAGLIQAADGNFYGTTSEGGTSNLGTIYRITPGGTYFRVLSFNGTNGLYPYGALVQGKNGIFYGTTYEVTDDIKSGDGTVFQFTAGKILTLHHFTPRQGGGLHAGLVLATDGNFYGTALGGGANLMGGSVFRITPAGKVTVIHSFCSKPDCADGSSPYGGLIQASDGNLYGTTSGGGSTSCNGGCGTIFSLSLTGKLTTLYNFCAEPECVDGSSPEGGLVEATNGILYGTTYYGGTTGLGTVFSYPAGSVPFVKTLATSGTAGLTVIILGTNLKGATEVSFNGVAARFTVVSSTEIEATVPLGATAGTVTVNTPSGPLHSNVAFAVTP